MGGVKIGELYGVLRLDKSKFDSGMKSAGGLFKSMEGMALNVVKRLAQVAAAAAVAFPAYAIKKAMEFETAMLNVNSIAKMPTEQFERMGQEVIKLTRKLPQSAETLAKGLYDIASSGFAGEQGLQVLEAAAMAASAGLTDTATSAKGITAVLNAYGLGAEEAMWVSDVMFKTVEKGVITFEQLSSNIGKTTAMASPLGVSFEEVAAGVALMTRKGIDGANATTQLNAIMQSLLKPSGEAADLARELGLEWNSGALASKGLTGVLSDMMTKTKGNHEQMATLLGNARAIRGAFVLAGDGGQAFNDELAIMQEATGATDSALSYQKQGLAYNLQLTRNKIDAAAITIGTKLMPKIAELAGKLADWIEENQELIGQIGGAILTGLETLVGVIGTVVAGIVKLVEIINFLKPGLIAVGVAVGVVATAIGITLLPVLASVAVAWMAAFAPAVAAVAVAVGAIAGISAAVNHFAMDFGDMGDRLHEVADKTGASYDTVKDLTKRFMEEMGLSFEEATDRAERALRRMPEMTGEQMDEVVAQVAAREENAAIHATLIAEGMVDGASEALRFGAGSIYSAAQDGFGGIPDAMDEHADEVDYIVEDMVDSVAKTIRDAEDKIRSAATAASAAFVDPVITAAEIVAVEAELASDELRANLASNDPLIRADAEIRNANLIKQLMDLKQEQALQGDAMAQIAHSRALLTSQYMLEGLASEDPEIRALFEEWEASLNSHISDMERQAAGSRIGQNLADAIASGSADAIRRAQELAAGVRGVFPSSEPKDPNSPFRGVTRGWELGQQIEKGIASSLRAADLRSVMPPGLFDRISPVFPALAEPGPVAAGMGGDSRHRIDIHLHDDDGAIREGGYDQGRIEKMLESALLGVASGTRHQSLRMGSN